MTSIKSLLFLALVFSQTSFTKSYKKADGCFTDLEAEIPVFSSNIREKDRTGLTKEEFMMVLDEVEEIYTPIFEELGKKFIVNKLWDNSSVNASAQQTGKNWVINMYGGLARHKHATLDSFRAVACHEIGHHLGGAPKKKSFFGGTSWATNEGQSDYFATYKCMKKLILEGQEAGLPILAPDLSIYEEEEIELAENKCFEYFGTDDDAPEENPQDEDSDTNDTNEDTDTDSDSTNDDSVDTDEDSTDEEPKEEEEEEEEVDSEDDEDNPQEEGDNEEEENDEDTSVKIESAYTTCKRAVLSGLSLGRLLNSLGSGKHISLLTPDTSETKKTDHSHPKAQCRADTYLAGALCDLDFNTELDDKDANIGTCNRKENFDHGLRPRCWFQPKKKKSIWGGWF